jgi:ABC-2 type transport system ATP-binding protein
VTNFIIETKDLSKTFADYHAVSNVDLQVPPGKIYGFLGPNGAGKTTTIRMLLGLATPSAGSVEIFGLDLASHHTEILARVGALVETPSLYLHLTGHENIRVTTTMLGLPSRRVEEVLTQVGLAEAAHKLVFQYSLGMKQRLGLALALCNNPRLIILDEPTNGLDPSGIKEMRDFLQRLAHESNVTVFLSSHLLNEIEHLADYIGIINHGKLLFQGGIAELRRQFPKATHFQVDDVKKAVKLLSSRKSTIIDSHTLLLPTTAEQDIAQIVAALVENDIAIHGIIPAQNSLEEMFIRITEEKKL